ncbi:MAG: tetratricopeptide repeat protein [Deltaproteobacteria bacterium]|nr:tetratricopeptide repeat protein [Candidatus Zymogenaceae bacterium]
MQNYQVHSRLVLKMCRATYPASLMVLLIFLFLISIGCVSRSAARWNSSGLDHYRHGDFENAYESFSEAIALLPDSAELYYNRANAAVRLSRVRDANADFTRAIELDPTHVDAYLARGDLSFNHSRYDAARADWSSVVGLSPNNADAYRRRGQALEHLDRFSDAVADFDRAVLLAPKDPACLISRGRFYFRTGQFDNALTDLTGAASLDPRSAEPYLYRGLVYEYGLFRPEDALADYSRAVDNSPKDPYVRNYRANLLRKLGKTADALADFSVICRMGYPFGCWQVDWLTDETK